MFKKDLFSGGISSIFISVLSILKSIFLIRIFDLSTSLDSFYLGLSIFQLLSVNITRYLLLSIQPNIVGKKQMFKANYFILSIPFSLVLNLIIFLGFDYIIDVFTENLNIKSIIYQNFHLFLILSISNTFFVIFNTYVNTIISIRLSLLFDFLISFLLFISVLMSKGDLNAFLSLNIYSYILLIIILNIIIYIKDSFEFILVKNIEWFSLIFKNFKNYLKSFSVNIVSSIFEKNILTSGVSSGDLSIYHTASKGVSPFTSLLANQSVLLVSYAKKEILQSKKLLKYHLKNISLISISIIVIIQYLIELLQTTIASVLNISLLNTDQIITSFQILSLSIFSSVCYSSIMKFLAAFNFTNYMFKLNFITGISLIIYLYFFKDIGLMGVIYAVTINSYLALLFSFIFLRKIIKLNILKTLLYNKVFFIAIILFVLTPFLNIVFESPIFNLIIKLSVLILSLTTLFKTINSSYE